MYTIKFKKLFSSEEKLKMPQKKYIYNQLVTFEKYHHHHINPWALEREEARSRNDRVG